MIIAQVCRRLTTIKAQADFFKALCIKMLRFCHGLDIYKIKCNFIVDGCGSSTDNIQKFFRFILGFVIHKVAS